METVKHIIVANGPLFTTIFVVLSLASVTVVVWRMWLNHVARTDMADFIERLKQRLVSGGRKSAMELCSEEPGIIPKIFQTTMQTCDQGKVATRNAIGNLIELEILPDLNFLLPVILIFAKLAPMFGLLGTVWGMILAFGKIAGVTKVNPADLANDIGMALYTTAEGLLLAIPLIFAYTMFRERVNRFELDLRRASDSALNLLPQLTARGK